MPKKVALGLESTVLPPSPPGCKKKPHNHQPLHHAQKFAHGVKQFWKGSRFPLFVPSSPLSRPLSPPTNQLPNPNILDPNDPSKKVSLRDLLDLQFPLSNTQKHSLYFSISISIEEFFDSLSNTLSKLILRSNSGHTHRLSVFKHWGSYSFEQTIYYLLFLFLCCGFGMPEVGSVHLHASQKITGNFGKLVNKADVKNPDTSQPTKKFSLEICDSSKSTIVIPHTTTFTNRCTHTT